MPLHKFSNKLFFDLDIHFDFPLKEFTPNINIDIHLKYTNTHGVLCIYVEIKIFTLTLSVCVRSLLKSLKFSKILT